MKKVIFTIITLLIIIDCNNSIKKGATQSSIVMGTESLKIQADTLKNTQIDYSLVTYNRDSICLYGKYKLGKTVSILNLETGLLFNTVTTSYTQYESDWETNEVILTKLKDQPSKRLTGESIAFFSKKPLDFKLFNQEKLNNITLTKTMDSLIRKSSLIDKLLKDNKCSEQDDNYMLQGVLPSLIGLNYNDKQIIIATYEIFKEVVGPRLAIFNEHKVVPLTGQCSFKFLYYYSLFGENYIYTGSGGCECGINAIQIFEIKSDTIVKTFEDYSFSN